jgi:hypothetical protein
LGVDILEIGHCGAHLEAKGLMGGDFIMVGRFNHGAARAKGVMLRLSPKPSLPSVRCCKKA